MRVVDVLLSIPGILLSLSIIIVLGFGSLQAAVACDRLQRQVSQAISELDVEDVISVVSRDVRDR